MIVRMVVPSLVMGGMEKHSIELSAALKPLGFDVRVVSLDGTGELDAFAQSIGVAVDHVSSRGWRTLGPRSPLGKYLREQVADVVHSHNGAWLRTVRGAAQAGVGTRIHTMHGFHERDAAKLMWMERFSGLFTTAVVAVSSELRSHATQELWIPKRRVSQVTNGIRLPNASRDLTPRTAFGWSPKDPVIIAVGRLVPVKNHALLLRCFPEILAVEPTTKLLLVGDGPNRKDLTLLAEALGISGSVQFAGVRTDTLQLLQASDIFCLPSLSEGLSISLLEAMAAGLPVVATAVGSSPEAVGPDEGILVPVADQMALTQSLIALVKDPERRQRVGQNAMRRAVSAFSIDATARFYGDLYRRSHRT